MKNFLTLKNAIVAIAAIVLIKMMAKKPSSTGSVVSTALNPSAVPGTIPLQPVTADGTPVVTIPQEPVFSRPEPILPIPVIDETIINPAYQLDWGAPVDEFPVRNFRNDMQYYM